ncbi:MAG: glutathione S-transferase C-terminal domain-containing protein [Pseudomonadota bacterium]
MAAPPNLVTLLPSTDVEISRWCLHRWGLAYRERPHAPIFHLLAVIWYGGRAYPIFIDGKQKLSGLDAMVETLDGSAPPERRLVPDATDEPARHTQVMDLQKTFRWTMGSGTVQWAYYHLLPHKDLTWASFTTGVPGWETAFLRVGYGLIAWLMVRGLSLNPENARKGLDDVRRGFDQCEELLADGRPYLTGDRLSFADLAFAGSAAPMVLEPGYGGHLPALDQVPDDMREVVVELRQRPAGAFVRRLYERDR